MTQAQELLAAMASEIPKLQVGQNAFWHKMPDDPSEAVLLSQTGGLADNESVIEQISFQILARGDPNDPNGGLELARALHRHLDQGWRKACDLNTEIVGVEWRFMMIKTTGVPSQIGFDEKERPLWSGNVVAHIVPILPVVS